MASAVTVSQDERCTHCWSIIADMIEPLALPCGHVGCTLCLEEKYKQFKGLFCHTCGSVRKGVTVVSLPRATYNPAQLPAILKCDRHECTDFADFFCIKCNEKLCVDDKKGHDVYFREGHEMISIREYEETAGKYLKDFCEEHKEEVAIKVCEHCKTIICNSCDIMEGQCTDMKNGHSYIKLATLAQRYIEELKKLLASAANKTGDIQKADKKSWDQLEADEEVYDEWMKTVEKCRDEHVEQLIQAYKIILEDIKECKKKAHDKVVEFNNQLIEKREALEESRSKVYKLVSGGSSADIIKQEEKLKEVLRQRIDEKLGDAELSTKFYLVNHDMPVSTKVEFIKLPSALATSSEHAAGSTCFSACHRRDGNVLLGCQDGVKLLNMKTMKISNYDLPYERVKAVIEHNHNVYILHKHDTTCKVEMLLSDMKHVETLFTFKKLANIAARMSVSSKYIVAYRPTEVSRGDLIIYDFTSRQTRTQSVATVYHPYFLPSGELLTAGSNQLIKYKVKPSAVTPVWTCGELDNVDAVCVGSDQLIYCATKSHKEKIYIISPSGKRLRTLAHVHLSVEWPGQISISKDELVVPRWHAETPCVFTIKR